MNPIDAKTSMIINIVAAILTGVAAGAVSFKGLVAPETAAQITGWSAVFAFVISCVNVGLHGYSSAGAGPMVGAALPPVPPAVAKMIFLALIAGAAAVILGGPASAQANRQGPRPQQSAPPLTGDPIKDIHNAVTGGGKALPGQRPNENDPLKALADKIKKLSLDDFKYAAALAHATGNNVTEPCWNVWVKLLTAQQQPLMGPDGTTPLTEPDPHLATDIERLAEMIHQLLPNSELSVACAPMASAAQKDAGTLIGAVLNGGALGLFKLPFAIP
jgi:hypothetical protein